MFDFLKKGAFLGLGLAAITKEKVEEFAKKIIEEKNLSEDEGRKLVDELQREAEMAKKRIESLVEEFVKKSLVKLDIPSISDIKKFELRIRKLEELAKNLNKENESDSKS